jgi:conjugation system TraG family ATPase
MRNRLKAATIESKFPLLAVEEDCIVSKDADVSVAFQVELPELFTVTSAEYEAIHSAWARAVKVLPDYCVMHKQDWFISEKYTSETGDADMSFLSRSYERHFNERPFLNHTCYLFLTKTTKERMRMQSNFSTLCRGFLIPKEVNRDMAVKFQEAVGQFERIVNDSGFITLRRLTTDEIIGTENSAGLVEKYFSLSLENTTCLQDMELGADGLRIGDKRVCLHTLSDVEDLPGVIKTDMRYERLSTNRSDCLLSFAAPVGLLLSCDHIYNQYLFLDNSAENLRRFERMARNMQSLSRYSRSNQINKEWIDLYLNEAHSHGLTSIRAHCNVIAWSEDAEGQKRIRNDVGSQLALMECKPRHNTVDAATLYWAGMPGNAGDFPSEESFYTFIEPALCFFVEETNYRSSPSPFGIKMCDRVSGKPLHLDISDLPMKKGVITNRNKFILGPSGSGKSFFTNHLMRNYYEQGSHILIVDMGNSYQGLFNLIRQKTNGEDGIYYTYTSEKPVSFNPFFTDDGIYDIEKIESLKTLLITLWKRNGESVSGSEEVAVSNAVNGYVERIKNGEIKPSFNTFYEFMKTDYKKTMEEDEVREKDFDLKNFLYVLAPFYCGGEYDYLLNSKANIDLMNKRAICFEIDAIKDNKVLFPVVTLVIMEAYINKLRRLKGVRKVMLQEEAWKAMSKEAMAEFLKYLYKTVRKYFGEVITVTQEVDDIISSNVVKESIIMNADCKILLDQRKYLNKFEAIQTLLGLTDKEKAQILSINMSNDSTRKYKEVWIGLGGVQSAVYATEVSIPEYLTYTTEESEKMEVLELTEKLGGNMELAVKQLAEKKQKK